MITKGNTQQAILKYSKKFSYDGTTTDNVAMMTIFACIASDNELIARSDIPALMALWDTFPKNPSAFSKDVYKWLNETDDSGAAISSKANKYLDMLSAPDDDDDAKPTTDEPNF